jgi:hypothetical protein
LVVTPSTKQITYEDNLKAVSKYWGNTCTSAQRTLWIQRALQERRFDRLGQARVPSGYEVFVASNMARLTCGWAITAAPIGYAKAVLIKALILTWVPASSWVTVVLAGWGAGTPPDRQQIWRAGPYTSPARNPINPEFRFFGFTSAGGTYLDSTVVSGKYYWFRVRGVDITGAYYPRFQAQILIP